MFALLDLDWKEYVEIDPRYFRPTEVDMLLGDASKARKKLGWTPKVTFKELASLMTEHDRQIAEEERVLAEHRSNHDRGTADR